MVSKQRIVLLLVSAGFHLVSGVAFLMALRLYHPAGVHPCSLSDFNAGSCANEVFTAHYVLVTCTIFAFTMVVVDLSACVGFKYTKKFNFVFPGNITHIVEGILVLGCAGTLGISIGFIGGLFGLLLPIGMWANRKKEEDYMTAMM